MGYRTRYEGELTIDPPLRYLEIRESTFAKGYRGYPGRGVTLKVHEERTETDDGPRVKVTAATVTIEGDELDHGDIMGQLKVLARRYSPDLGHRITGTLHCRHEHPDVETPFRVVVDEHGPREVWPALVWPDDPEAIGVLTRWLAVHRVDCTKFGAHEAAGVAADLVRELVAKGADR